MTEGGGSSLTHLCGCLSAASCRHHDAKVQDPTESSLRNSSPQTQFCTGQEAGLGHPYVHVAHKVQKGWFPDHPTQPYPTYHVRNYGSGPFDLFSQPST